MTFCGMFVNKFQTIPSIGWNDNRTERHTDVEKFTFSQYCQNNIVWEAMMS
jgi:hypothetical protein